MSNDALFLSAPLALSSGRKDGEPPRFEGVAYSGGLVPDYGVVVDLASARVEAPMPLLFGHRHEKDIGVIERAEVADNRLTVAGQLFAGIDPDADKVVAKARAGAAYQLSVGLFDFNVEFVGQGKTVTVNGQQFQGPVEVIRDAHIRETSVVALGADPNTAVTVFARPGQAPSPASPPETPTVSDKTDTAALEAENQQLKAELEALRGELAAMRQAAREAEVKALFQAIGREYSAEVAKPFLDLPGEAFAAVAEQMKALAAERPAAAPQDDDDHTTDYRPSTGGESTLLSVMRARYQS